MAAEVGSHQVSVGDELAKFIPIWNDSGSPTLWIYCGDDLSADEKEDNWQYAEKIATLINGEGKQAAPALLALLTEPLRDTLTAGPDFATDLEHDATILELHGYNVRADALRAKAQAIRAAVAAVKGENER